MKKIAIVANTAFNIYNFRLGLMQYLEKEYEVFAVAPNDDYSEKIIALGYKFIPIKQLKRKGTNPIAELFLINELYNIYKENKFDIVLQYTIKPNIYGSIAAKLARIPSICTVTGLGYTFLNNNLATQLAKWLYRIALKTSSLVNFQNIDDKILFIDKNLVDSEKAYVVNGSGIDIDKFNPIHFPKKNNRNSSINFLFVGRLLKDKGIYEYLAAAKIICNEYNNVCFSIIGSIDKNNPSSIREITLQENLIPNKIIHLGYQQDIRQYLADCSCLILPSYREGLSKSVLEAMAMEKPCLVSNVPGCKDAIDTTCGFLFEKENINSLVIQIKKFINLDEGSRIEMGESARKRTENLFSQQKISELYKNQIKQFIS